MIELKVECDCGQKYKFEVEPIQGQMPFHVTCPACGEDGTQKANLLLKQMAPPSPVPQLVSAPSPAVASPPVPVAAPPVIAAPPSARPVAPAPIGRPGIVAERIAQPQKGNDGWSKSETGLNKLGSYVMLVPSIIGAMVAGGFFGMDVSPMILAPVVGIFGVAGGAINILGRGPILVGMLVGLTMTLGGYGAVYWWISDRTSVQKFEIAIAFLIGAAPGYGLQFAFQKIILKRQQPVGA